MIGYEFQAGKDRLGFALIPYGDMSYTELVRAFKASFVERGFDITFVDNRLTGYSADMWVELKILEGEEAFLIYYLVKSKELEVEDGR